ncbi:hypothetical protein IFM89_025443 [Coptis chinensis]|uniref:Myb/SANT-like domain-containing protein n=1 Tax=Coptis chinensis TaxID=261450 RepID=A0A835HXA2_9MAGN|nr:hypothetical protein IFM89_025443 [Coptis chinensis]
MAGKQKKVVKTRSPQIRWYPNMEAILVEVLLEELATGGKRADNGWRKESLKRTADEINTRLGMNCVSDNIRSRLKTMRLAWQVAKHAVDASGFGGNSGFDDDMVDGDDSRQTQGDGGDDSDASESSAIGAPSDTGGDTSQTDSGPRSTTPTSKKTRKSRFFEDIPPPSLKVLIKRGKNCRGPQTVTTRRRSRPNRFVEGCFAPLPDMNPELFLRSLDLSGRE